LFSASANFLFRLDEIQGIERQLADIKSSLDGSLGDSLDADSKVRRAAAAAAAAAAGLLQLLLLLMGSHQAEALKVVKAVSSWLRVKSEKATVDEIKALSPLIPFASIFSFFCPLRDVDGLCARDRWVVTAAQAQKRMLNEMWDPIVKQAYAGGSGGSGDDEGGSGQQDGSGEHDEM
jgi:hypothetical protein